MDRMKSISIEYLSKIIQKSFNTNNTNYALVGGPKFTIKWQYNVNVLSNISPHILLLFYLFYWNGGKIGLNCFDTA